MKTSDKIIVWSIGFIAIGCLNIDVVGPNLYGLYYVIAGSFGIEFSIAYKIGAGL